MPSFIRNLRLSGLGAVVAVVLLAAVGVGIFASGTLQIAGWVVVVAALVFIVGGVPDTRMRAELMTSTRRGRTISTPEPEVLDETTPDADAWRREREHRERTDRAIDDSELP